MTSVRQQKELRKAFGIAGLSKLDDKILSKCAAISSSNNISPEQMGLCWETFSLNRDLKKLDEHCFDAFRTAVMKHADNSSKSSPETETIVSRAQKRSLPPSVTPPAKRSPNGRTTIESSALSTQQQLGEERRVSLSPEAPKSLSGKSAVNATELYQQRKGAGEVVLTYNPHELAEDDRSQEAFTDPRCKISSTEFDTNVAKPYRHMNTTIDQKSRLLDRHLLELGDVIKERFGLGEDTDDQEETGANSVAALEAVGIPRQEPVCCIGRICNEAQEGRMNATSVLLEGSRDQSGGTRIQLDLSHLKANKTPYSLFPGQIVAVEGLNPSGRKMVAHRICEGAPPSITETTATELLKFHHQEEYQGGKPLKLMTVAGPYATVDGLDYQPLFDFMHRVQAEKPDVVIMTGPFVDMRQESMRSGCPTVENDDGTETTLSFEAFFADQISALFEEFLADNEVATQFVLVPSVDDATAEWVYPQAPFREKKPPAAFLELAKLPGAENFTLGTLGLDLANSAGRSEKNPKRIHCVSNPCTLKINELVVGVTSADVLFHLGTGEANANLPPGSRLERLAQHLIQQQNYYPLFPHFRGLNLDLKQLDSCTMPCQPDILLVPSKFNAFARPVLENTLAVNPGHLTKGTSGGSYATIQIHPIKRETLEDVSDGGVLMPHQVAARSRVQIKRI